jgi:type 1 glutamine amidotransferase
MKTPLLPSLLALLMFTAIAQTEDPKPIFDGKSLAGWSGDTTFWSVEDGAIVGRSTAENPLTQNTFLIWQDGKPADFELTAEFLIKGNNSGIQFRSELEEGKPFSVTGPQADISADNKWTGAAYFANKGIIATRGEKVVLGGEIKDRTVVASVGDPAEILSHVNEGWNTYRIIASGNQVIQLINGVVTCEYTMNGPDAPKNGLIALQLHQGAPMEVRFRNIRLQELQPGDKKKILFLAGRQSHGPGQHEHKAGCLLLARCLNESGGDVTAQVTTDGQWPQPWVGYDKPDSVVMYCDGYRSHLAKNHQDKIQALVDQGVGVACLHFGVEVEKSELGSQFLDWIGGYFEDGWSVNPHWTPVLEPLPDHPISSGVKPFEVNDEWYYHMRFRPKFENTTAILSAKAPVETLNRKGSRGTNPTVQAAVEAGEPQIMAWAYERPNGGRGFGFTGGHFHKNWQQDDFRKLVLNALCWTAKAPIPPDGITSRTPTETDMELNQDQTGKR